MRDNNDLYQVVLVVSAVAGCLGAGALLDRIPWMPLWLAGVLAAVLGWIYGDLLASIVCQLPGIRERGEVTTNIFCKVLLPYCIMSLMMLILRREFVEATERARAAGHRPLEFPPWAPLAAIAFPLLFSVAIAVVARASHASERRRRRR